MLTQQIRDVFADSDETYGYRRVWHELARRGIECGPELVRAIMRRAGLVACQPRPWRQTTIADPDAAAAASTPDLVGRDFTAAAPGVKLVGDITYIPTWQGFVYLATVIDCHTKMVAGYALAEQCVPRWSATRSPWQPAESASPTRRSSTRIMPRFSLSRGILTSPARLEVCERSAA